VNAVKGTRLFVDATIMLFSTRERVT
jgi:hypothetical protein